MAKLLKIVVTDSGGTEHIFNNMDGEEEQYIDLRPCDNDGSNIVGAIKITSRAFGSNSDKFEAETESLFINPRRVDIVYGAYDS